MSKEKKEVPDIKARDYQSLLIEHAIKENSIIYLPTGSGKTFISIEVIKYFGSDLEKPIEEGGKRTAFLVNTNALAVQQTAVLQSALSYEVGIFTGEQNVDFWTREEWQQKLKDYQVLVATTQVILDAVNLNFISLTNFNVMVFDECHHARKNHPMHELMNQFKFVDIASQPRVIGLSGMLIGASITPEKVLEEMQALESTFLSKIITVDNLEEHKKVLVFSTNPIEAMIRYEGEQSYPVIQNYMTQIDGVIDKIISMDIPDSNHLNPRTLRSTLPQHIKDIKNLFENFRKELLEMGIYGGYLSLLSLTIEFELVKKDSDSPILRRILDIAISEVEWMKKDLSDLMDLDNNSAYNIQKYSSQKIRNLINFVKRSFSGDTDLQCIIFVKRRYTAKVLYHLFKEYAKFDKDFHIIPDFMVGYTGELPESIEAILKKNFNREALNRFREHETNCIISSSVLEEGIDIQSCNLVIMYDRPETYRGYVQTKGRARFKTSQYIVFVQDIDVEKFNRKKINFDQIDKKLQKVLIEKVIERLDVDEESIEKERKQEWPPYVTKNGAKLTGLSAISLLHRYCNMLPNDMFSNANVAYERIDNKEDGRVLVNLKLPKQSSIQHCIRGEYKEDVRLAKQYAAFKACIELHKAGELSDYLLPIDSSMKIEEYNYEYFQHWEKYDEKNDNANKDAGISKRRVHKVKIPEQFLNCQPKVGMVCYVYQLKITPIFEADVETLRVFKRLYENSMNFGILTTKQIPKLCKMKFFQSYGEVHVTLADQPSVVRVESSDKLMLLQNFHVMIFRDLLTTWKPFFVPENDSYLIVPLVDGAINWEIVKNFQKLDPVPIDLRTVKKNEPKVEDFEYKVINPYYQAPYSNGPVSNYIVTKVHTNMSPLTTFPTDVVLNYKSLFELKYNLKISYPDQFLIEVRGVSKNLNLLFPGGGKGGKLKRQEKARIQEILIPEVCHAFKFPGSYWLKATLLPVALHRIHYMLCAEIIREKLTNILGITRVSTPQQYELDVDYANYDETLEKQKKELKIFEKEFSCSSISPEEIQKALAENVQADKRRSTSCNDTTLRIPKHLLPLDLDRNWTTASKADIQKYEKFLDENKNVRGSTSLQSSAALNGVTFQHQIKYNIPSSIRIIGLNSYNAGTIQQKDIIKALTTSKSGDVFDMERFEVLGDGYLKFITSLFLYKKYANWHEGYLTSLKGKIVSNRNLFYCGNDFGLPEYIKFLNFQPRTEWVPPSIGIPKNVGVEKGIVKLMEIITLSDEEMKSGMLGRENLEILRDGLENIRNNNQRAPKEDDFDSRFLMFTGKQHFKDKVVADCMEALLGVCVNSVGAERPLKFLKHFKILPQDSNTLGLLTEKIPPRVSGQINQKDVLKMLNNHKKCEKIIGYVFNDRTYLLQALTHSSYPLNSLTGCYQQLEFLGDAVLDFLITSYIFEQCPDMDPGRLTDLRSALVNNVTLGCIVVRHQLHKFLLSQNYMLMETINAFVKYQEEHNHEITDQIELLITENQGLGSTVEVPKALGDIFESIVGGIYLDSGMDLQVTWNVVRNLMQKELFTFMKDVPKQLVRRLFEYPGANPRFEKIDEEDVKIEVDDKILVALVFSIPGQTKEEVVIGIGNNKKSARKAAAKLALRKLNNIQ